MGWLLVGHRLSLGQIDLSEALFLQLVYNLSHSFGLITPGVLLGNL